MEVELNPIKDPTKRPAAVRPSEESDSDADPGCPTNALYLGTGATANPSDTRPNTVSILHAALNAWETTAQRNAHANKYTDGPPACVLCKQKGLTSNYLGCPYAPKRAPPPEKTTPRRTPRAFFRSRVFYTLLRVQVLV
ncbi:hypothetical protein EVAR_31037_1 [Eumeta japonica]|uniref:Uncharacterized protein n=1 Tax=Eumeta variegata TaxID=151549 RepID=A0A4C1VEK5_EUMVA|nr:hypothetical protein EVAR_31037_1 [Eumeta japonica]